MTPEQPRPPALLLAFFVLVCHELFVGELLALGRLRMAETGAETTPGSFRPFA